MLLEIFSGLSVSSSPFIYAVIYLYPSGLMGICFILWVMIQYYIIHCTSPVVLFLFFFFYLGPFQVDSFVPLTYAHNYGFLFIQQRLSFCYKKMFWDHLSLPQPQSQPVLRRIMEKYHPPCPGEWYLETTTPAFGVLVATGRHWWRYHTADRATHACVNMCVYPVSLSFICPPLIPLYKWNTDFCWCFWGKRVF